MATSTIKIPGADSVISVESSLDTTKYGDYRGGYSRYGRLIFVNIRVNVTTNIPSGGHNIFSSGAFPLPITDGNGNRNVAIMTIYGSANPPYIDANGALRFGGNFTGTQPTTFFITGMYMTDE